MIDTPGQFRAGAHVELAVDARQVDLDGLGADEERGGDFAIGHSRGGELGDSAFPGTAKLLTAAERRVAEFTASGMTNREVATALFISPKTVEVQLTRIYRKLNVRTRAELARRIDRLEA